MTQAKPARKPAPKPKAATKRLVKPGASPISGTVPPPEHRFKPGNQAGVGHGRPRTLHELRELILETLAEETGDLTRAKLMVRTMLIKSPSDRSTLLEYAFGKVKQETQERTYQDDIIDLLVAGTITEQQVTLELPDDAQRLIATARLRRNAGGEVEAAGATDGGAEPIAPAETPPTA